MRTQFIQEKNDNLKGMIYAEGHPLNTEAVEIYAKKHGSKTSCKCVAYTHQRTNHNSCPLNEKKKSKIAIKSFRYKTKLMLTTNIHSS